MISSAFSDHSPELSINEVPLCAPIVIGASQMGLDFRPASILHPTARRMAYDQDWERPRKKMAMNIKEGVRRLGLVVGVLGASAGAVVAYTRLQPLLTQRAQWKAFQSLVSCAAVQKEIAFLKKDAAKRQFAPWDFDIVVSAGTAPPGPWSRYAGDSTDPYAEFQVPKDWLQSAEARALDGSSEGWKVDMDGVRAIHFEPPDTLPADFFKPPPLASERGPAKKFVPPPPVEDKPARSKFGGIPVEDSWEQAAKELKAGRGNGGATIRNVSAANISYIETANGQNVYRIEPPRFWSYLLIPLFLVLGFFFRGEP